jgi:hypothetical protein
MKIITANRLLDGAVVYRTAAGGWAERFAEAARFSDEAAPGALADAERDVLHVIRPYLAPVEGSDFGRRERVRETIRAKGPSVRPDLGKQAEGAQ